MVVGVHEELELGAQLLVGVVVVPLDGGVFDGAVHPLNLTVIRHDVLGVLMSLLIPVGSALW
jgi:hypothetical protein